MGTVKEFSTCMYINVDERFVRQTVFFSKKYSNKIALHKCKVKKMSIIFSRVTFVLTDLIRLWWMIKDFHSCFK